MVVASAESSHDPGSDEKRVRTLTGDRIEVFANSNASRARAGEPPCRRSIEDEPVPEVVNLRTAEQPDDLLELPDDHLAVEPGIGGDTGLFVRPRRGRDRRRRMRW